MSTSDLAEKQDLLVSHAKTLVAQLESGDSTEAMKTIAHLHHARDETLFMEVGKLTRSLHTAIQNLHLDTGLDPFAITELARMEDASDRLRYVVNMTERAANKTMDMVDETLPLSSRLGQRARELRNEWARLMRREMTPDEFRVLYKEISQFLDVASDETAIIESNLSTISLAQDYQDLTGQVIKKVISLVQEVEKNLVDLVKMAGQIDQIAGFTHEFEPVAPENPIGPEGPIINPEKRLDVVTGQDDVDALLSSLGF